MGLCQEMNIFFSVKLPQSPSAKFTQRLCSVTYGDDPQISIHRYFIPGLNQGGCVRDAGNARQSVFACDNGAMNQHPAPALDNSRRQGHDKGYNADSAGRIGRRIYSAAPTRGSSVSILKSTRNFDSSFSLMYWRRRRDCSSSESCSSRTLVKKKRLPL